MYSKFYSICYQKDKEFTSASSLKEELFEAVDEGDRMKIKDLIKSGVSVNSKRLRFSSRDGLSEDRVVEMMQFLGKSSPDDFYIETPLTRALDADKRNMDVILDLIQEGADLNAYGRGGNPALIMISARKERLADDFGSIIALDPFRRMGNVMPINMIRFFVNRGADINIANCIVPRSTAEVCF